MMKGFRISPSMAVVAVLIAIPLVLLRLNIGLFVKVGLFCVVGAYVILKAILPRRQPTHARPPPRSAGGPRSERPRRKASHVRHA